MREIASDDLLLWCAAAAMAALAYWKVSGVVGEWCGLLSQTGTIWMALVIASLAVEIRRRRAPRATVRYLTLLGQCLWLLAYLTSASPADPPDEAAQPRRLLNLADLPTGSADASTTSLR